MAERRTIARPYAKAIFELAKESQSFDDWLHFLKVLCFVVENEQVVLLLKDEMLEKEKMVLFFQTICEEVQSKEIQGRGAQEKKIRENFIRMILAKKRFSILPEILVLYEEFYNEAQKMIPVKLTASVGLNDAQKKAIEKRLMDYFHCSLKIDFDVDPKLLGGFIARAGNYVIDNSVLGFLGNLKVAMGG